MDSAGERFEAIRAALADRNNILTVKDLCELAGVSRSGYYNWVRSEKNRELREAKDRAAFEQILEAYRFRGYAKGVRGIHMRLLHMGIRMNVKKIRRLMRKYKLTCPIRKPNPYRRLQRSIRMGSAAENLVNREFESHGPRAILLTDITYIPLCGRFCYLSTILDACTKQVLAYAMSESLEVDFVLETVQLLVKHHGISLSKETVIHSDQGTHYTSLKFIQLVENSALRRSMSRRGNCWDNAPQESFFGHMKDELASEIPGWTSFEAAKASIDRWMDYYNNDRCQWDLAKLSPNEYYHYITTGEYPAGMLRYGSNENVLDLGSTLIPFWVKTGSDTVRPHPRQQRLVVHRTGGNSKTDLDDLVIGAVQPNTVDLQKGQHHIHTDALIAIHEGMVGDECIALERPSPPW